MLERDERVLPSFAFSGAPNPMPLPYAVVMVPTQDLTTEPSALLSIPIVVVAIAAATAISKAVIITFPSKLVRRVAGLISFGALTAK